MKSRWWKKSRPFLSPTRLKCWWKMLPKNPARWVEETLPPEEEEGMGMALMIAIISAVNLGLIGAGWFIYRRTISKEDEERETVQEEITRLQKQRNEATRGGRQPGAEEPAADPAGCS